MVTTTAIPPGGEGEIKATLRTKGRSGKTSKRITVVSNDSVNPRLILTLQGEIVVDVSAEPRAISFGQVGKTEKSTRELKIVVAEPEKIKVTEVASSDPRFAVTRKDGDPAGTATYEVAFQGSDKIERISAQIIVKYEGSDVPSMEVPVSAIVVGDLRYRKSIYFARKEDGFKREEIVFTSRSGKEVELKRVEDPDGKLKVKIETPRGTNAVVSAEVADQSATYEKPEQHVLQVHTTDPDEPVVEIRYTITDRRTRVPHGARAPMPQPKVPPIAPQGAPAGESAGDDAKKGGANR